MTAPAPPSDAPAILRVFVVDDHPMFRHAVRDWLSQDTRYEMAGEAQSAAEALAALRLVTADLIILDISLQGPDGLELIKHLTAEHPGAKILVLSMHEENIYAARALRAGASGYMMKSESGDTLLTALDSIARGEVHLSPAFRKRLIYQTTLADSAEGNPLDRVSDRELEVLRLVGSDVTSREIASRLHLSIKTIESHRLNLKHKLRLESSEELVRFAREWVRSGAGTAAGPDPAEESVSADET